VNVLITGGLGFVGTQLSVRLLERGHQVTVLDHSPEPRPYTPREVTYVYADTSVPGAWQQQIAAQHAVINLAGASIFRRWNTKTKKFIHDSRILTTGNVVQALAGESGALLCSTSAVGYYGFRGDEELTEESEHGDDFLATVCVDWEREANTAIERGARVVITRFGIVLGKTGGALGQMIPTFRRFVGGPLGSGKQWFSWIHMEDLVNAFLFTLDNPEINGPVNFCSPKPVRNEDLARALGKALSRPSFFRTPAFLLRLFLGEFGSMVLKGQRVIPAKLIKAGFAFQYPELEGALHEVVGNQNDT